MAMQMRMLRTGASIRRIVHDCAIDADGRGNAGTTLVAAGSLASPTSWSRWRW
jgi:hypothetical protein